MPLRAVATDGQVHTGRYSDRNDDEAVWVGGQAVTMQAGISSAAHDLACPREQIRVVLNETDWQVGAKGSDILLDGCGQRATYRKVCALIGHGVECRLFLTSRFSLHEVSR